MNNFLRKMRVLCFCCTAFYSLFFSALTASAQEKTIYSSPYVSVTEDGKAWTTNAGDRDICWYEEGEQVQTGIQSSLRQPGQGEHYYMAKRQGMVPVGRWQVQWKQGQCIHGSYPTGDSIYHGILYNRKICQKPHFSGWVAYCADCGGIISDTLIYMSREAASTIDYIKLEDDMAYYYLCPFCSNLEQARGLGDHLCKAISYNQYQVRYDANCLNYSGYMVNSIHMYENADVYEGKTVSPATHLSLNSYTREGYVFEGWNTEADGSGKAFSNGEEVFNLTDHDYHLDVERGTIVLYAQWRAVQSTLHIDPNGGSYYGRSDISFVTQDYGTVYRVDSAGIKPPAGHIVSFECNGGSAVPDTEGTMHFTEWRLKQPFHGIFQNEIYYYTSSNGEGDLLTACYDFDNVILPSTEKQGSSFGGWYYDAEFDVPAGAAGDSITPTSDMTLYARWVDLLLISKDNYQANEGKGAVDLSWSQPDSKDKWYLLYQSPDGKNWNRIFSKDDIGKDKVIEISSIYNGVSRTYTVEAAGLYTLTAAGAQGGSYGSFEGGQGGSVTASFWLKKGEVLTYTVGGTNGYNGGGKGSMYTNGGGCTIVTSDQKGVLLVAGGGGGATGAGGGGAGGSEQGLLITGYNGGDGGAGGGGGYRGGAAGEQIVHHHTESCYQDASYNGLTRAVLYTDHNSHVEGPGCIPEEVEHDECYQYSLARAGNQANPIPVKGNTLAEVQAILWKAFCVGGELWEDSYLKVYDQTGRCFFSQDLSNILHESGVLKKQVIDRQITEWALNRRNVIFPRFTAEFVWRLPEIDEDENDTGGYTQYWSVRNGDGTSEIMGLYKENEGAPLENLWGKTGNTNYSWFPDYNFSYTGDTGYHLENTPLFFVRKHGCPESGVLLNYTIDIPAGVTGIYVEAMAKGHSATSHDLAQALVAGVRFKGGKELKCGMQEGQVISSKPSYGGSSYVNAEYAYTYSQQAGIKKGDGNFQLKSISVGYVDEHTLMGVQAPDLASPDAVEVKLVQKTGLGANKILVTWKEPKDNGTLYYHVAESYFEGGTTALCRSNDTMNTLISGVKGYFYCIDENSETKATDMSEYTEETRLEIQERDVVRYLHLAAVDVAGNLSDTIHIPIHASDVTWPLYTEQLSITAEAENIYPAGDHSWFVRSDGTTPFSLWYSAYIDGTATEKYQINHAVFVSSQSRGDNLSAHRLYLQNQSLSAGRVEVPEKMRYLFAEDNSLLTYYPYTKAYRDSENRTLSLTQSFTMDKSASGKQIEVYPRAGADWERDIFYSAQEEDITHGLILIGDGEPPVIRGMDILQDMSLIDRRVTDPILSLTAEDALSGVREFYLTVHNTDNNCERKFLPDEAGVIQVKLTDDDQLFSGDFTAIAYAADNVGNERIISKETTEFGLTAQIERILSPHEPVFRNGESGILTITVWGYPDYVEVEFPREMTDQNPHLDRRFEYEGSPRYCQEEQMQFMIPLYTPANTDYAVTVRAYKGDKKLEQYPELSIVEVSGTILDDFRTRLR